jgi:ribosomal protein S18 acetylase RimI-like enzyme
MLGFEASLQERLATRKIELDYGRGLFNDDVPFKYDANFIRVEHDADVTVELLARDADRLMDDEVYEHRRVLVNDEELGKRLEAGFEALGWKHTRFLWMGHVRPPSRATTGAAFEMDNAAHILTKKIFNRREPYSARDDVVLQMARADEMIAAATLRRAFGVRAGGVVASVCETYSDGTIGQIEDVATLEEYRGKGLATQVVLAALDSLQRANHELIFLVADADDWPKAMYEKLGFEAVGVTYQFIRLPEFVEEALEEQRST